MAYSPKELGLTLSYECDLKCSHCVVKAGPKEKGTISPEVTAKVLDQAQENGITSIVLYGGEPFLQRDLLLKVTDQAMSRKFNVYINSNGSWGETRESARENLSDLRKLVKKHRNRYIGISLSVDQYHQPQVPIGSIANIIAEHRLGESLRIQLDIATLRNEENGKLLTGLLAELHKQGIYLATSKFHPFLYPALPSELKGYGKKQRKNIIANLGLDPASTDREIEKATADSLPHNFNKKMEGGTPLIYTCFTSLSYLARGKDYIIIPDNYLIKFVVSDLFKAGRSTTGKTMKNESSKALFIDPTGNAFLSTSSMRSETGVPIEDKSLSQVIYEVGKSLK